MRDIQRRTSKDNCKTERIEGRSCDGLEEWVEFQEVKPQKITREEMAKLNPALCIGSPQCALFSTLQFLGNNRRNRTVRAWCMQEVMLLLEFACLMYKDQIAKRFSALTKKTKANADEPWSV